MNIKFKNESDKNIILTVNGIVHFLMPHSENTLQSNHEIRLSLTTEDDYSSETASEKRGLTLFHRFITVADYNFTLDKDSEISLRVETARGNNLDSYQRVIPSLKGGFLPEARYTVKNEATVRQKLEQDKNNLNRFDKKLGKFSKVLGVGLWLEDAFTVIGVILLALILLWIIILSFKQYPTVTAIVLSVILIIGFISWKTIKKVFNFAFRRFDKILNKHGDKVFVPGGNIPSDLYKDDNSYFDNEYISAVFRYSTKRK